MSEWIMMHIMTPLIPIACGFYCVKINGVRDKFVTVLGNGNLCFFSTLIAAAILFDIIKNMERLAVVGVNNLHMAIIGMMLCIIFSSVIYGQILSGERRSRVIISSLLITFTVLVIVLNTRIKLGLFQ